VSVDEAVTTLLDALPGCFASTTDPAVAQGLLSSGATVVRHAHLMRMALPAPAVPDEPEFRAFVDGKPPVPWAQVLPAFLAAYPPDHPDHLEGGGDLIDSYLIPYTAGSRLGPLLSHASAIAVRDGVAYGGILVVDRPGEGPWVCDLWRDPDPAHAGAGLALLHWAASRLRGFTSLGLAVTVGNDRAVRTYEKAGFARESTAWTVRLPEVR